MKKFTFLLISIALILMMGRPEVVHAEIIPPYGEGQIGLTAEILCESLTLRQEPSSSAGALQSLRYGDHIIVMEQTNGWARCALGDAEDSPMGWVNADYIIIDPARYRTEEKTAVYAWDDTTAPKVALLNANTVLPILKTEGEWLIVSLRGATGWIHVTR